MKVMVTGAAGFIGYRVSLGLLADGFDVVGVDAMDDYYSPHIKQERFNNLCDFGAFIGSKGRLADGALQDYLSGVDAVIHLAGRPGVRASWGTGFGAYARDNVTNTQFLLDGLAHSPCRRIIYASSSSVYGQLTDSQAREHALCQPVSPYGVSKLAAELLCHAYAESYGFSQISLRLFTVYGGGQRPDMAFQRIITAAIENTEFQVFGDGHQRRDFTHVEDVSRAFRAALLAPQATSGVFNVAGGTVASIREVIASVGRQLGQELSVKYTDPARGDVLETWADTSSIQKVLGWTPEVGLDDGLSEQISYCLRMPRK